MYISASEPARMDLKQKTTNNNYIINMARREADRRLGEVEQLVLIAVLRVGDGAYAVPVRKLIEDEGGVRLTRASVYITLDRLEKKGLLTSSFSEPTAAPGGKARRIFRLQREGLAAMRVTRIDPAVLLRAD